MPPAPDHRNRGSSATDRPPAPSAVTTGPACEICVGPALGCWRSESGAAWCRRRCEPLPGYLIVGRAVGATAYRRCSTATADPEARARLVSWLTQRAPDLDVLREALSRAEGGAE